MGFFNSLFGRWFGPPSHDQFARLVAEEVRRAGESRPSTYDKPAFRLVFVENGKEVRVVNLANLYLEYCAAPRGDRKTLLQRTCKAMIHHMEMPEDFEDVKPDLMPTVRPRSLVEHMRLKMSTDEGESAEMAWLPLTDHLVICLVYDLPNSMQFIMADQIEKWGVKPHEALEIALLNLAEREFAVLALGENLYVVETGDSYDGTRLLLKDRLRRLKVAGLPIVMPVSRNTLLITGSEDTQGLGALTHLTEMKMNEARPLCPIPMVLVEDEWETWSPPTNHSQAEKLREFKLQYLGSEYAEQKEALDKLNEETETDIFVASFMALEKDGKRRSWSTWSKGVTTWLPETDFVAFYDPDTKASQLVSWSRVDDAVGHLMTLQDCYPPRWLVDEFPSPEEIDGMSTDGFRGAPG